MSAYYNDNDPYNAKWIRNLIDAGHLPPGDVDDRSIIDVSADDLIGYEQVHLFAGIGGWPFAGRLAQIPDDFPYWSGSCPCQPFSISGKRKGFSDERHLWPEFKRLLTKQCPSTVFGEQVARAPDWLNLVRRDLEEMGYAVGAIPMEAASAGAEHFRDRYWFVADNHGKRKLQSEGGFRYKRGWTPYGCSCALVDRPSFGWGEGWTEYEIQQRLSAATITSIDGGQYVKCPDGKWRRLPPPGVRWLGARIPSRVAKLRAIGNAIDPRCAATFMTAYLNTLPDY